MVSEEERPPQRTHGRTLGNQEYVDMHCFLRGPLHNHLLLPHPQTKPFASVTLSSLAISVNIFPGHNHNLSSEPRQVVRHMVWFLLKSESSTACKVRAASTVSKGLLPCARCAQTPAWERPRAAMWQVNSFDPGLVIESQSCNLLRHKLRLF